MSAVFSWLQDDLQSLLRILGTKISESLTRWNANQCCLLQTPYHIFEALYIHFLKISFIFKASELFHQGISKEHLQRGWTQNLNQGMYSCTLRCLKQRALTNSQECTAWTGNHL